jgi:outer membrane immunogenic protein
MKRLFLSTSILAGVSLSAIAADLPARSQAPAPAPTFAANWAGLSVGGQIGYSNTSSTLFVDVADPTYFPDFGGGEQMKHRANSAFAGIEAAYNFQQGNFVYGAFASISGLNAQDQTWSAGACCGAGDDMFTTRLKGIGILGARVGYATDRALFHVGAGYALGNMSFDITDNNTLEDGSSAGFSSIGQKRASKWLSGFALGTGVDYQITNSWTAGIQYTYVNFGSPIWDMTTSSFLSGSYMGEAAYVLTTRNLDAHLTGVTMKYILK